MNSIPVNMAARMILNLYDKNHDHKIDLKRLSPKELPAEAVRSEDFYNEGPDSVLSGTRTYTMIKLFEAADENQDKSVTLKELADFVTCFDSNGNGSIEDGGEASEERTFSKAYGQHLLGRVQVWNLSKPK